MASYFEGWYFKHRKGPEILSVIPGRARDGAFLQVITGERSWCVRYPAEQYRIEKNVRLCGNYFARNGIRLCIRERELELSGELRYRGLSPINGDIMGPFQFLPMQCRHTVVSMDHMLAGKLRLNGKEIDFTGGRGYIEGDSGFSFPKSYTWVQCNDFGRSGSIMAAAAHIPFACTWFWGCICVVWLEGTEYRLATYKGAKIKYRDARQLLVVQNDLALRILFLSPDAGHLLDAPGKGTMERKIREAPASHVYFEFRRGDKVLFQAESRFASCEHVL